VILYFTKKVFVLYMPALLINLSGRLGFVSQLGLILTIGTDETVTLKRMTFLHSIYK
jgi:hypothetical protein